METSSRESQDFRVHDTAALFDSAYLNDTIRLRYQPLIWVHDDWLRNQDHIGFLRALGTPKAQAQVAKTLHLNSILAPELFEDPIKRLLFLSGASLQHLLEILGLVCFRQQLELLIEKSTIDMLNKRFNANDLEFVQQKSRLLVSQLPDCMISLRPLSSDGSINNPPLLAFGCHLLKLACNNRIGQDPDPNVSNWQYYLKLKLPKFNELAVQELPGSKHIMTKSDWDRLRIFIKKMALDREDSCTNLLK